MLRDYPSNRFEGASTDEWNNFLGVCLSKKCKEEKAAKKASAASDKSIEDELREIENRQKVKIKNNSVGKGQTAYTEQQENIRNGAIINKEKELKGDVTVTSILGGLTKMFTFKGNDIKPSGTGLASDKTGTALDQESGGAAGAQASGKKPAKKPTNYTPLYIGGGVLAIGIIIVIIANSGKKTQVAPAVTAVAPQV